MYTSLKVPKWVCNLYLQEYYKAARYPAKEIGLQDREYANIRYRSRRNPGLNYTYVASPLITLMNRLMHLYLWFWVGHSFRGTITSHCAPVNAMTRGTALKPHRDRYFLKDGKVGYPRFIAVMPLVGYNTFIGGEFYYNRHVCNVSDDGKDFEEYKTDRRHINPFQKGRIYIIRNDNSIHGVTEVLRGTRITLTFRSK